RARGPPAGRGPSPGPWLTRRYDATATEACRRSEELGHTGRRARAPAVAAQIGRAGDRRTSARAGGEVPVGAERRGAAEARGRAAAGASRVCPGVARARGALVRGARWVRGQAPAYRGAALARPGG